MAKLTKTIFGVPDGEFYPRDIEADADCPPNLEAYAASIGAIDADDVVAAREKAAAEAEAAAKVEAEEAAKAAAKAEAKAAKKAPENK